MYLPATYLAVYLFTGYFFSRTTKHKPVSLRTINCAHKHRPLSTYGISWIQRDMTKMSNMFQDCISMVSWILIVWGTSINDVRWFCTPLPPTYIPSLLNFWGHFEPTYINILKLNVINGRPMRMLNLTFFFFISNALDFDCHLVTTYFCSIFCWIL